MRVFLAVPGDGLDEAVRARRDELDPGPGFRRLRGEGLHVTVVFIGEVDGERLSDLEAAAGGAAAASRPFRLAFDRFGGLGRGPSRVAVLKAESPAFEAMALEARRALAPFGQVSRERRRPLAHVTIARSRAPQAVAEHRLERPITLEVASFALFESFLEASGARYEVLRLFQLGDS